MTKGRVSKQYVGAEAAAGYLEVSKGMLDIYIRQGRIVPGKVHARMNFFSKIQLDDFIRNDRYTEVTPPDDALLGITDAADHIGITKRNLRYHTDEGHVTYVDLGNRRRAYTKIDLKSFVAAWKPTRRKPTRKTRREAVPQAIAESSG